MRVVQLITRMIVGGAQRIALETAVALRRRGVDVEIWTGPQTGPEGDLAAEVRSRSVTLRRIPGLVKEIDPLRDSAALLRLVHALRRARPDLLHTHSSKAGILGRAAARLSGIDRTIHTVHGWGFSDSTPAPARAGFIAAERVAARWADRLIAVSDEVRLTGLRHRIGRSDLYEVIRPGIEFAPYEDLDRLRSAGAMVRRRLGITADQPVAGTIGRLAPQKNPGMILDAARLLPETVWLLIGDGPLRADLEKRIAAEGLQQRVRLVGLQNEISDWIGALDLFVLPSLWEGLPLTMLEAGAAGIPVVAARVSGVVEALPAEPAGYGFTPGDLNGFVAATATALKSCREARSSLLEHRERIRTTYSRERMCDRILRLYR